MNRETALKAIQEKQMSPHSHYPATLRFGDNLLKVQIPRRRRCPSGYYAPGIIPNSLWLLDSSTSSSNFTLFVFSESHYD